VDNQILELTAHIVASYVEKNSLPAAGIPDLVASVSAALQVITAPPPVAPVLTPAVNPKRSVHDDHLVCLEDGRRFKSLKRHLMAEHGLTPGEYRTKWNLAADYPMVAPAYSAARSSLAISSGLGRKDKSAPKSRTRAKRAAKTR
jgi:predicted transcriptional regulator